MMEAASIPTYDFFDYIALKISAFAVRYPEEFLSATDVHAHMRGVEKRHPGLIADGFGKDSVSVATLTEILHELVRQGVSIRDFRGILEGVASYCASSDTSEGGGSGTMVVAAVEHVKMLRRRQIVQRFLGNASSLRVVSISEDVQNLLSEAAMDRAGYPLGLDEEVAVSLSLGLEFALKAPIELGVMPLLLLCPAELKEKITYLVRRLYHPIQVIGLEDITPSIAVEQVGLWGLAKT
jgi:flagellar biosynthesis component FlhA